MSVWTSLRARVGLPVDGRVRAAALNVVERLEGRVLFAVSDADCPDYTENNLVEGYTQPPCDCEDANEGTPENTSGDPVRYFDGTPVHETVDLYSDGFGRPWGHTRGWAGVNNSGPNGNGWVVKELPYLTVWSDFNTGGNGGGAAYGHVVLAAMDGGTNARLFNRESTTQQYSARSGSGDRVEYVPAAATEPATYELTDAAGNVTVYYDLPLFAGQPSTRGGYAFQIGQSADGTKFPYGAFKSYTDAAGNVTEATYDPGTGLLQHVDRTDATAGVLERFTYTHAAVTNSLGGSVTLLDSVSLERGTSAMDLVAVRTATYQYYTGETSPGNADPNGRLGDLKLATIHEGDDTGPAIDRKYYRYHKFTGFSRGTARGPANDPATTGGPEPVQYSADPADVSVFSGLKTVVEGAAFDRLEDAISGYATAPDDGAGGIRSYVNNFFRYERWGDGINDPRWADWYHSYTRYRVTDEVAQGAGCSTCSGGLGSYHFNYQINDRDYTEAGGYTTFGNRYFDPNVWRVRTIEFLPDTTNALATRTLAANELTSSGTEATMTWAGHGFSPGETISILGANESEYNGTFTIKELVYTDQFTFDLASSATSPATGTISVTNNDRVAEAQWADNYHNVVYSNEKGQVILTAFADVLWSKPVTTLMAEADGGAVYATATVTGHGLVQGDKIVVMGADGYYAAYDGRFVVTDVIDADTFVYEVYGDEDTGPTPVQITGSFAVGKVGQEWSTFHEYDLRGRRTMTAQPSAVTGYDEQYVDLVHRVDGNYEYVDDAAGVVERRELAGWAYSADAAVKHEDATSFGYTPTDGDQAAVFQYFGGAMSQAVRDWQAGTYSLTYAARDNSGGVDVQVLIDGDVVDAFDPSTSAMTDHTTSTFTVSAGTHTLEIRGGLWVTIDDLRLARSGGGAVPTIVDPSFEYVDVGTGSYAIEYQPNGYALAGVNESTAGDVAGYLRSTELRHGELGTPVPQSSMTYFARSAGGATVHPVATETVFRNDNGTGAQTTSYAYTWQSGTTQAATVAVTLPTVTTAQNGPNSAAVVTAAYDAHGRQTWSKDAGGYLTYTQYDADTGAVTKQITDVDTSQTGTFANLPGGWTTPGGGGLHLTTTMVVDGLGRTTKLTDPNGNVTYTVYKDADHEVRVYPGWNATTGTTTGPTQVFREDRVERYTESLTMSATPDTTGTSSPNLVPTGAESVSGVQSLTREYVNDAGQVVKRDRYASMPGGGYSAAADFGTLNTNYYRTEADYDQRGRMKRVKDATGTITWTLYDGLGRPTSTWVGTDDTGAVNGDPDGTGSPNNMLKVSENQYDGGQVGDSRLTTMTADPTPASVNSGDERVTDVFYDWRGRAVATKAGRQSSESDTGVQRQIMYCTFDNLGNQTACETYDADGVSITRIAEELATGGDTDGVPNAPASSARRSRQANSYDEWGRVYRTDVYSINPSTGAQSASALRSETWYDKRGNVLKTAAPGGVVMKYAYDGPGRVTTTSVTDGDELPTLASLTRSSTTATATLTDHAYLVGDTVTISGASQAPYNGTFTVTAVTSTTFSYTMGSDPGATASGTVKVTGWRDASHVLSDAVLEQADFAYDANGNMILTTTRHRFHDEADTGGLGTPTSGVNARVRYSTVYYDAADRPTTVVDYGTSGAVAISARPAAAPGRSNVSGTGTGGSTTTLVDTARTEGEGFFVGYKLRITGGTGSGQSATVTGYNASTKTLTLSPVLTTGLASGSAYTLEPPMLITNFSYNAQGLVETVTDPRGIVAKTHYDLLGRTVKTVEAEDGTDDDVDSTDTAIDRTTLYAYDGVDHVTMLTALLPDGVDAGSGPDLQQTQYVYGVTTGGGSHVNSNAMLREVAYPNKTAGTPGTTNADKQRYTYNALGDVITFSDQNGSVHTYSYDVLGRPTKDAVTTLGSGVDGAVRRLETAYNTQGMASLFTSYDAATSGTAVNQVKREFNGLGQLTREYQDHDTTVSGSTPYLGYAYTEMAGGANHSRQKSMTYPDGRILRYEYASGIDSRVSRVSYLADDAGGTVGTHLEDYSYLGLGTVISQKHPEPNVDLTYVGTPGGDGGDQYVGLDRFGRVVDQRWARNPATPTPTELDRFKYGYDRNSNVLYKDNQVSPSNSELYHEGGGSGAYDLLNRLTAFARGTLSDTNTDSVPDTVASPARSQEWELDPLGNWKTADTGGAIDTRSHNAGNQLTATSAGSLSYDANGNMLSDDGGRAYTYDAWNRLAVGTATAYSTCSYSDEFGNGACVNSCCSSQSEYEYDALGRRTRVSEQSAAGYDCCYYSADGSYCIYYGSDSCCSQSEMEYTARWQVAREHTSNPGGEYSHSSCTYCYPDAYDCATCSGSLGGYESIDEYVWGNGYVDDMVLRDREATGVVAADASFSGDGQATTDFSGRTDGARGVAVQPDGKLVVVGSSIGGGTSDVALARYNANGSLDTSFGTGGQVRTNFSNSEAWSVVDIDADGDILIGGYTNVSAKDFAVARYNSDGSLDTTFGSGGVATADFGYGGDVVHGLAVQADGKIVTVGSAPFLFSASTMALARFNADGSLDDGGTSDTTPGDSFGTGGKIFGFGTGGWAVSIQPDGKIVAVGSSTLNLFTGADLLVVRLEADGSVDTTFGTFGEVTISDSGASNAYAVALGLDGAIYVAGDAVGGFVVAKLSGTDGSLDTTFNTTGVISALSAGAAARAVAVDGGGRVTVAGQVPRSGAEDDFAVLRLLPDGSYDTGFGASGSIQTNFATNRDDVANGMALLPDGGVVVVGDSGGDFAVARYTPGGTVTQRMYALQDANYNVTALMNTAGSVVQRFQYDPYGTSTVLDAGFLPTGDAYDWTYRHQGGRLETATGLYHFRNRDYSPTLGRWVQNDPVGYIDGLNLAWYVRGNPVSAVDPKGLSATAGPHDDLLRQVRKLNFDLQDPCLMYIDLPGVTNHSSGDRGHPMRGREAFEYLLGLGQELSAAIATTPATDPQTLGALQNAQNRIRLYAKSGLRKILNNDCDDGPCGPKKQEELRKAYDAVQGEAGAFDAMNSHGPGAGTGSAGTSGRGSARSHMVRDAAIIAGGTAAVGTGIAGGTGGSAGTAGAAGTAARAASGTWNVAEKCYKIGAILDKAAGVLLIAPGILFRAAEQQYDDDGFPTRGST